MDTTAQYKYIRYVVYNIKHFLFVYETKILVTVIKDNINHLTPQDHYRIYTKVSGFLIQALAALHNIHSLHLWPVVTGHHFYS